MKYWTIPRFIFIFQGLLLMLVLTAPGGKLASTHGENTAWWMGFLVGIGHLQMALLRPSFGGLVRRFEDDPLAKYFDENPDDPYIATPLTLGSHYSEWILIGLMLLAAIIGWVEFQSPK